MKDCLIIFAKEPEKGRVKTRLASSLSQTECLRFYKLFLKSAVALARDVDCDQRIIAYDSCGRDPSFLKRTAPDFEFYRQKGRDLGERMFKAFKAFTVGKMKTVIIGSDSPGLPASYIARAFKELDRKDLVLGPTYDGGYYMIGLKEPHQAIFEGIEWGSGSVFAQTLKNAAKSRKKTAVLDFWYDIDTPQDLRYIEKEESR